MCLRHCVYHNLHLLPSIYDFMFIKKVPFCIIIAYMLYLSCTHHVSEFSTVLTAYDTI